MPAMIFASNCATGGACITPWPPKPAIIQSPRGDDERFLNTAWTLSVVRGCALWLLTCALAWPIAWYYHEPLLAPLIVVTTDHGRAANFRDQGAVLQPVAVGMVRPPQRQDVKLLHQPLHDHQAGKHAGSPRHEPGIPPEVTGNRGR